MKNFLFTFIALLLWCQSYSAYCAHKVSISGILTTEVNKAITHAQVNINGVSVLTNKRGEYTLTLPEKSIYLLRMEKPGFYDSVQSFSHHELNLRVHHAATMPNINITNMKIPNIILVEKKPKRVMLAFGGDVMMGRRFSKPYFGDSVLIRDQHKAEDTQAILQYVKPYMSIADLAAVNLETQIADHKPSERAKKSVTFYSPPETLSALSWAGIDYVTLGNNHTFDYLNEGLLSTLNFLSASKLGYSGAGINQKQALKAYHQTINDTPLALLGYVGWQGSASPNQTADTNKGGAAFGSMENITASVKREVDHQQVAVVQYHGSQEYSDNPTGVTEQRLKSALDNGAALAIAHHPHVSQGFELYNNKLIAYSMGNFVFDQYFAETPHSFILYVWLDAGKFHRAEIVPLYLKGYQPTPATGLHRRLTMKRLQTLSSQRATYLQVSGGHGVITSTNTNPASVTKKASTNASTNTATNTATSVELTIAPHQEVASLASLPWQQQISNIELSPSTAKYRLGTNLVNGSDFESFANFDSDERGMFFNRSQTQLANVGANSQHSLALTLQKNSPQAFGMQSFRRVYKPSSPMTISANVKTTDHMKMRFYWQGRKKSQKFFEARTEGKKHLISTLSLTAADNWQPIAVSFNSPRIGYRSFRVFVEIETTNSEKTTLYLDDFAVIEWQTAFSHDPSPLFINSESKQAAYIGVNTAAATSVKITTK